MLPTGKKDKDAKDKDKDGKDKQKAHDASVQNGKRRRGKLIKWGARLNWCRYFQVTTLIRMTLP